jgi:phthalate 4,5-dioxygenase
MTISQWHVPVDDTGCYWYAIFTSFGAPVDKDTMRDQRLKTYPAPDYKPIFNRSNSWGFDADEQKKRTFTGMGFDINIHDQWACESQGPIQDRTKENLGATDKGIVLYRRLLLDAIRKNEAGQLDVNVEASGPPAIDGIGPTATIDQYWKQSDEARRRRSAWAA